MIDVDIAAKLTITATKGSHTAVRDLTGRSKEHAMWMLHGIGAGYIMGDKAQRWLGYAQGILVCLGALRLIDAKSINQEAKTKGT